MARALDVDPPPVGEVRGEVMGSVFGDDKAFTTPGQQEGFSFVRDTRLEAREMLQERGVIRRTTVALVALPHEAPAVATLQQGAHPIVKALWIALRTNRKRHLNHLVHCRRAAKVRHEAAHPRRCGEHGPRCHIDHRQASVPPNDMPARRARSLPSPSITAMRSVAWLSIE